MIRTHENPMALRAGALSLLVHGVLLALLLVSFNWHSVQPASVAEVELWDSLPTPQPVIKPVEPVPQPPKPEPVLKPEPKPEPAPEPKAEIQIKKEKPKAEKPLEKPVVKPKEPPKPDLAKEKEKQRQEQIRKLQEMVAADQPPPLQDAQEKPASVSASEVSKYIGLVSARIRPYVNKQPCGSGQPELTYKIAILPTGEMIGEPKLIKSSGIAACDDAVYRAIKQSGTLPKPEPNIDREFNLKFRPNGDN